MFKTARGGFLLLGLAATLATAEPAAAVVIDSVTFDGPDAATQYGFYKGPDSFADSDISAGIKTGEGVGGTDAYGVDFDSSGPSGTDYYFYAGLTRYTGDVDGSLPSADPSQYTFSVDIETSGNSTSTPIDIQVYQYTGVDPTGAVTYRSTFTPTLVDGGGYTHVSFALDEGVEDSEAPGGAAVFDPTVPIQVQLTFNNGGYGLDAGNSVRIDNSLLTAVPEPASLGLLGAGGLLMLARRRRA